MIHFSLAFHGLRFRARQDRKRKAEATATEKRRKANDEELRKTAAFQMAAEAEKRRKIEADARRNVLTPAIHAV